MKSKITLLTLMMLSCLCFSSYAQSGANDPTFNPSDKGFGYGDGADIVFSTVIQSDGKIIIGGSFTTYNGMTRGNIARLNIDGTIDSTFNSSIGADSSILAVAIQPDGKIIIAGEFDSYNGTACGKIARLNTDGSLDATFNAGTGANLTVHSIALQSDGKVIVAGDFISLNDSTKNHIARLNMDGSLDATFNIGTGFDHVVYATKIQSDGKIIVGGGFTTYNGIARKCIARINANGSIDATFNVGTGVTGGLGSGNVQSIAVQADGKIIIGGDFYYYNGIVRNMLARINVNGSLDGSFNANLPGWGTIRSIAIQNDGKIIVNGVRLNTDGSLDSTFSLVEDGSTPGGSVYTIAIQSNGKIILGGHFQIYYGAYQEGVVRINSNGSNDYTFNVGTGFNFSITSITLQNDGKILVGGYFTGYNGKYKRKIVRLNEDGSLDETFTYVNSGTNGTISSIVLQNDGKILIGESDLFTTVGKLFRLNNNGSRDTTFHTGTGADDDIHSIALQSDGKIFIVGDFEYYNGTWSRHIARLNTNGTFDSTFHPITGPNGEVNDISILSNGKILIGGYFTEYNNTQHVYRIARINTDGSLDGTFHHNNISSSIYSLSVQNDGKIIIAGDFDTGSGDRKCINRLDSNGSYDTTFHPVYNTYQSPAYYELLFGPNSTHIQRDGKIIIGGFFTSANGTSRNYLLRLNTDGTIDTTFNTGTGPNSNINAIAVQSDDKILIGGAFTTYNGIGRNRIARLENEYLSFSLQPTSRYICSGESVSFGTSTNEAGLNHQWQVSTNGGATFTNITSAGSNPTYSGYLSDTLVLTNTSVSNYGYVYRCVLSNNVLPSCNSNPATLFISSSVPSQPTAIVGSANQCLNVTGTFYSVVNVPGTIYNWSVPDDWSIIEGQGTNRINVRVGPSGSITVAPSNGCGTGPIQTLAVSTSTRPAQATRIIGDSVLCYGTNSVVYSVDPIVGATSYTWTVSTPWVLTSGQGTNSITVTPGVNSATTIKVSPSNNCGFGVSKILSVTRLASAPITYSITGNSFVCAGATNLTYSIPNQVGSTYNWTVPNGWTINSGQGTSSISVTAGSVNGAINVTPSNACGVGSYSTMPVSVALDNVANAGTIDGATEVCMGEYVIYTIPSIANATSYVWTLPIGATGSSSSNSINVHYLSNAVSGNITVKGHNVCGDGEASTLAITVKPNTENAGAISGPISVCKGQDSVTYTVPEIANATSYVWTLPNGAIGTSSTNTITVDFGISAVSGNITVKGTGSCGDGVISTLAITVSTIPGNAATIIGPTTVCQGQNTITYSVPIVLNATSYVWTLPNGALGTSSTNTITVDFGPNAASGNISVSGISFCGDGVISTLAITVNPIPGNATTIIGPTTVCQGQNSEIYSVSAIEGATSYIWSLPNGVTGTSDTNSISVNYGTSAISGDITVKGNNSCGNGAIASLPITVNPLPENAGTISGTTTICMDQNAVIYSVPAIAGATSYIWSLPDGATGTSVTNSISVNYGTSAISGDITVKGNNSCGDGSSSTLTITVNPIPATPIISQIGTVLHSNSVTGNQWYNQSGILAGATNQDHSVIENGNYYVVVTLNDCSSLPSNTVNVIDVGVIDIERERNLKIYPNPVSSELIIEMAGKSELQNFEILNSMGQVVFKGDFVDKTIVQTANFAPGVYLVKIENGKTVEYRKMVKQ